MQWCDLKEGAQQRRDNTDSEISETVKWAVYSSRRTLQRKKPNEQLKIWTCRWKLEEMSTVNILFLTRPAWVCPDRCVHWRGRLLPGGRAFPGPRRWRWGRWGRQRPPLWTEWCSTPESWRPWQPTPNTAGPSTGRCRSSATDRTGRSPWFETRERGGGSAIS